MTNSEDLEDADAGKKSRKALESSTPRHPSPLAEEAENMSEKETMQVALALSRSMNPETPFHPTPERHAQEAVKRRKKPPPPDLNKTHQNARVAYRTKNVSTGQLLELWCSAVQFHDTSNRNHCFKSAEIEGYGTDCSRWGTNDVSIELTPNRQLTYS